MSDEITLTQPYTAENASAELPRASMLRCHAPLNGSRTTNPPIDGDAGRGIGTGISDRILAHNPIFEPLATVTPVCLRYALCFPVSYQRERQLTRRAETISRQILAPTDLAVGERNQSDHLALTDHGQ